MASVRAPRLSVTITVIVVLPSAANSLFPATTVMVAAGSPEPPPPVWLPLVRLSLLLLGLVGAAQAGQLGQEDNEEQGEDRFSRKHLFQPLAGHIGLRSTRFL